MAHHFLQAAALRADFRRTVRFLFHVIMRRVSESEIRPAAIVVGCGDVGSAVAHALHNAGCAVVLVDHADPPWTRRGMAYTDAWYVGTAELVEVDACFCASVRSIPFVLDRRDMIAATTWSWQGVAEALHPIAIIDARIVKRQAPASLKTNDSAAPLTIGLGPGFVAGVHVDIAIETAWGDTLGAVIESGGTKPFEGEPRRVGGAGRERYVYAGKTGRFQSDRRIGDCVASGEEIATLGGDSIAAPLAGVLRGLSARGARIGTGQKIVEVDPRGEASLCFGLGERPRRIATGVVEALQRRGVIMGLPRHVPAQSASLHG
jgi:xanthine dehydrogenase accessory factor